MGVRKTKQVSVLDYVALEDGAIKHEYEYGQILAMTGGSLNHGVLCGNIFAELRTKLKGKNCRTFGSEVRVHIQEEDSIVYPDASVVCGKLKISDEDKEAINH